MSDRALRNIRHIFACWIVLLLLVVGTTINSSTQYNLTPPPATPALPPPPPTTPATPAAASQSSAQPVQSAQQELPLIPSGKAGGSGSLGTPSIAWDKDAARVVVTIPCTGTTKEQTTFSATRRAARCFDIHGKWKSTDSTVQATDKTCPVRMVQTGQHGTYVRISCVGDVKGGEIRRSPEAIVITFTDAKPLAPGSQTTGAHKERKERKDRKAGSAGR